MHKIVALVAALCLATSGCAHVPAPSHAPAPSPKPSASLPPGCVHASGALTGTICAPPDAGRHPAMILLGGSEGGDAFAPLLPEFAQHGYVAATVDYFGAPGLPPTLVDIPVETVGRAIATLSHRSDVDATRIGILGMSKGGEFALLAASTYPQIKAAIAVVPSPFAYFGLGENSLPTGCSWSKDGVALPCVPQDPSAGMEIGVAYAQGKPLIFRHMYDKSRRANPAAVERSYFPLDRIAGPVLCLSAAQDQIWNSSEQCSLAKRYLRLHRHSFDDRFIDYKNAGHMFLLTRSLATALVSYNTGRFTIEFGGTPAGDLVASRLSWPVIWSFLAKALHS
jgi:dienelactone hydrolase